MRMMRWASGTPKHFLFHVRGAIHAIKEMDLDNNFHKATEAVKSANLQFNIAKMAHKDELKKGE